MQRIHTGSPEVASFGAAGSPVAPGRNSGGGMMRSAAHQAIWRFRHHQKQRLSPASIQDLSGLLPEEARAGAGPATGAQVERLLPEVWRQGRDVGPCSHRPTVSLPSQWEPCHKSSNFNSDAAARRALNVRSCGIAPGHTCCTDQPKLSGIYAHSTTGRC